MTEDVFEYGIGEGIALLDKAKAVDIHNESDYKVVGEIKEALKAELKRREEYFEPLREKAYTAYCEVLDKKNKECEPYRQAIAFVQKSMSEYLTKIENERREAQRKAEAEAERKAEEERQRLLERAAKAKTESKQEELLEKAEMVFAEPVIAPPVQDKTIRTDSGVVLTGKRDIEVDVVELRKLCKAVGDCIAPETIVEIKSQVLKNWVKSAGIKNGQVPGIVVRHVVRASGR